MFLVYWLVQAFWVFLISLPVVFVNAQEGGPRPWSNLDYVCISAFAFAVVYGELKVEITQQ